MLIIGISSLTPVLAMFGYPIGFPFWLLTICLVTNSDEELGFVMSPSILEV